MGRARERIRSVGKMTERERAGEREREGERARDRGERKSET